MRLGLQVGLERVKLKGLEQHQGTRGVALLEELDGLA
jgi:hypothetical protein